MKHAIPVIIAVALGLPSMAVAVQPINKVTVKPINEVTPKPANKPTSQPTPQKPASKPAKRSTLRTVNEAVKHQRANDPEYKPQHNLLGNRAQTCEADPDPKIAAACKVANELYRQYVAKVHQHGVRASQDLYRQHHEAAELAQRPVNLYRPPKPKKANRNYVSLGEPDGGSGYRPQVNTGSNSRSAPKRANIDLSPPPVTQRMTYYTYEKEKPRNAPQQTFATGCIVTDPHGNVRHVTRDIYNNCNPPPPPPTGNTPDGPGTGTNTTNTGETSNKGDTSTTPDTDGCSYAGNCMQVADVDFDGNRLLVRWKNTCNRRVDARFCNGRVNDTADCGANGIGPGETYLWPTYSNADGRYWINAVGSKSGSKDWVCSGKVAGWDDDPFGTNTRNVSRSKPNNTIETAPALKIDLPQVGLPTVIDETQK